MADTLSIGVSGLLAFHRALDTTSHNIANASTPGYSRQRVELATRVPTFGFGTDGSGVKIAAVTRSYDQLLGVQMRTSNSSFARLDTYTDLAESINNLFANSETGLDASLQKFTNALQSVAATPTSIPARQVLLSEANALNERLETYDSRLRDLDGDINTRIRAEADSISGLARSIADLNQRIVASRSATGREPNDLLDQREELLKDLSAHITVSTVAQDDGAMNVFVGNGQSLVLGRVAARIGTAPDAYGAGRLNITYETPGSVIDIGAELTGGALGGLLDAQRELIDPARNQLGRIAAGLAAATNAQHAEGMDLNGNLGGNVFATGGVQVLARTGNPGTASIAATRTDIGALTDHDYVLQYDGTSWTMREEETGTAVTLTGAGTSGSPLLGAGLSLVVSGTPAAGAGYLVRPTAGVIDGMSVLISDPSQVAAAAPIRTATGTTNLGTAQISAGEVLNGANPALRNTTTIQFLTANTYSVNGAGSFAYTNGANIDLNGWRVAITGTPQAGDTFTVANNAGGVGDNRNAQALASSLSNGLFNGGTDSIDAAIGRFVGSVGVATNQAQSSRDAQKFVLDDTQAQMDSVSGVNLDEEAANMLRYQQAYQAAAQVIRTSQMMFDSLMAAVGR